MLQKVLKRICELWIVGALACAGLYAGAYLALLNPEKMVMCVCGGTGRPWDRIPNYRWKSPVAEGVFLPIHRIDRIIRPWYWSGADYSSGFAGSSSGGFGGGFGGQSSCANCRR